MIISAIALSLVGFVWYRLWLAPLARLPGPTICALTRLPLMYHEFNGNRRRFIHALHLKYGPVVRVAPDEISFATREAVKEIYTSGGSGYDKHTFYVLFRAFDRTNMFSTIERGEHADKKKRFSERYSKTHIMSPDVASVVQEHATAFVTRISENLGTSQDVFALLHCFALDGITNHLFYPRGLHSLSNDEDYKLMKELTYTPPRVTRAYLRHYFPRLAKLTAPNPRSRSLVEPYVLDNVRSWPVASHTVLSKLRTALSGTADPSPPAPDSTLAASECMDHLVAGIDTTGDGLCFLLHHLSRPTPAARRVQSRLLAELAQRPVGTPHAVDALPYLDAVVKEGLRVFSPIPMSFPRVVPRGGGTVDGVRLPGGTVVSCQPYTLHRLDEGVFPDPEEFVPERWLEPEGATERNQLFFAFAAGGRGCIGKHLALLEMKLLLKEVYSNFRTRIAPDMDADMTQDDQTISSRPKGLKCLIVFEKIDDGTAHSAVDSL
ncbi:cytochrome P450 [Daedaleopsis nitida]|nr:cytochrome P450 [Daedaleopsis nitida]